MLECAKRGFKSDGVELNLPLVIYSKFSARKKSLSSLTHFYRQDILKTDLSKYHTAILFGAESMVSYYLNDLFNQKLTYYFTG